MSRLRSSGDRLLFWCGKLSSRLSFPSYWCALSPKHDGIVVMSCHEVAAIFFGFEIPLHLWGECLWQRTFKTLLALLVNQGAFYANGIARITRSMKLCLVRRASTRQEQSMQLRQVIKQGTLARFIRNVTDWQYTQVSKPI